MQSSVITGDILRIFQFSDSIICLPERFNSPSQRISYINSMSQKFGACYVTDGPFFTSNPAKHTAFNEKLWIVVKYYVFAVFFQPSLTQPLKSVSMCDDNVFELVKLDPQRRSYRAHFRLIKHYGKYQVHTHHIPVYSANST